MAWDRRRLCHLVALAAALSSLAAFSPRGLDDWRRHSLFILFRDDHPSDREIATRVSRLLVEKLPQSRAEPLAVTDLRQIGEFLLSRQFDVALLRTADGVVLAASPHSDQMTGPLVVLARARDHLLISRADLPAEHAAMIAAALSDLAPKNFPAPPLPWHPAVGR